MTLTLLEPREVLKNARCDLGLPTRSNYFENLVDQEFLTALLRHSAGFLCPCSGATLRHATLESLNYLVESEKLIERIDEAVEGLITGGDLLELNQVTTDDPAVKGTWLFAAPPSCIERPSGTIFLTGIVPDQNTYLPHSLSSRVKYEGYTRMIVPKGEEDLISELVDLGLQKIPQADWFKAPQLQTAEELRERMATKLQSQPRSGLIPQLELLNPIKPVTYYRGRWTTPNNETGLFVGRRPQEYGAPIWCFVELYKGAAKKLLDLPIQGSRWRSCDSGWHLQMAIDCLLGKPQLYRLAAYDNGMRLDFFSPLPIWAERRLMILGRKLTSDKCLMSYWIPENELEEEENFLRKHLWLIRQDATGGNE